MSEYEVLIFSPFDRENLVAELWFGKNLIAEISKEKDMVEIEIFNESRLVLEFDAFIIALEKAKKRLLG